MTSTTDEITNLRAALESVQRFCQIEIRCTMTKEEHKEQAPNPELIASLHTVRQIALSGLKTPRASKIVEPITP